MPTEPRTPRQRFVHGKTKSPDPFYSGYDCKRSLAREGQRTDDMNDKQVDDGAMPVHMPGGLLMAKIIMPDTEAVPEGGHEKLQMERSKHGNVILAAASGTSDGLRLAVNIGAMLVAFVALIALFNGLVGWVFSLAGIDGVTMQLILGKIFQPLMYLLSVPWQEAEAAGALFGEKIILNEFVAFSHLQETLKGMSPRTIAVTTFSLCGFANLSSIAILLGGLGVLVPEKKELIGKFGMKCVLAASLSNLMSAALAGLMLPL